MSETTKILASRSEAKRAVQANMISINKVKINDPGAKISKEDLLYEQFMMVESGKRIRSWLSFSK